MHATPAQMVPVHREQPAPWAVAELCNIIGRQREDSKVILQTVGGELLPKMLTFSRAELVILWTIMPMHFWCIITSPFLKILNGTTAIITKLLRIKEPSSAMTAHTGEELKMLVSASPKKECWSPKKKKCCIRSLTLPTRSPPRS